MNPLDKLKNCTDDLHQRRDEITRPIVEFDEYLKNGKSVLLPFTWNVPDDGGNFLYSISIQKGFGDCKSWQAIVTVDNVETNEIVQKNIRQLKLEHRVKLSPHIDKLIEDYIAHLKTQYSL
jgi:hypothetical protein